MRKRGEEGDGKTRPARQTEKEGFGEGEGDETSSMK